MESLFISSVFILLAAILQTCTGFGFSIMATPFLLLVYPPREAIQINIILSIIISAFMIPSIIKEVDRVLLNRLAIGSLIGSLIGIAIFLFVDVQLFKIIISLIVLFSTFLLFLRVKVQQTQGKDYLTGSLSGMLTTSIGVPGIPLLIYFSGTKMEKTVLRSTTLAYFLFIYLIALGMQLAFASTNKETWIASLILLPITILGMYVGHVLFRFISQRVFQIITYVILGITGVYLLISSI